MAAHGPGFASACIAQTKLNGDKIPDDAQKTASWHIYS
jgi:hypothetical protein